MTAVQRNFAAAISLLFALGISLDWMQAAMARHMLLQMPALACAGWLLHASITENQQARFAVWNQQGILGFVFLQGVALFWMVPRALDLALVSAPMAGFKIITWITAGFLLRQSMRQSNPLLQFFMLGNFTMMTCAVSDIYENAPTRLCNAYGQNDQEITSQGLLWLCGELAVLWVYALSRSDLRASYAGLASAKTFLMERTP